MPRVNNGVWWRAGLATGIVVGLLLLVLAVRAVQPYLEQQMRPPSTTPTDHRGDQTMTLYAANGTRLTKTAAAAKTAAVPVTDPVVQVTENLYEGSRHDGTTFPESRKVLKFAAGTLIRTSQLNACFPDSVVSEVLPASGPLAGGNTVTVKGKNFTPGSTVAFGGTAATDVIVVDETTISCKPPAKAAGAVAVQVTTDAGPASKANAYTYA